MKFYLGTHRAAWLSQTDVPLFVSRRQMPKRRFKPATCDWALDSGGFTELTMHGRWTVEPERYVDEVRAFASEVGRLEWAAVQDWMCEPAVIHGGSIAGRTAPGTGLTLRQHQQKTTESFLTLNHMAPDLPWAPVLQGWEVGDYVEHVDDYLAAGVDLWAAPIVGVGSVCRRQGSAEIAGVFSELAGLGLPLHGFGVKASGLAKSAQHLATADSLAWSYVARRRKLLLPECEGLNHKNCANCLTFALKWREDLLSEIRNCA